MAVDPTLIIGTTLALVTASAHAFVLMSKDLWEWRKGDRRQARPPARPIKADRHGG